jgi:hypothetical protein
MSEVKTITLAGKEYIMKDVSILGTKMLGAKLLEKINLEQILDWIIEPDKRDSANKYFYEFASVVFTEAYVGPAMLELKQEEVINLTNLFFELAIVPVTKK